jgi:hypothetical protein
MVQLGGLKGSVFPLTVGKQFSYEEVHETVSSTDSDGDVVTSIVICEVQTEFEANRFHKDLTGKARLVACNSKTTVQKRRSRNSSSVAKKIFFDALGIWLAVDPISPKERIIDVGKEYALDYRLNDFALAR